MPQVWETLPELALGVKDKPFRTNVFLMQAGVRKTMEAYGFHAFSGFFAPESLGESEKRKRPAGFPTGRP